MRQEEGKCFRLASFIIIGSFLTKADILMVSYTSEAITRAIEGIEDPSVP